MRILRSIRLLLIAMWFGAALYFSAVVAPAAFSVLRSFQLANAGEIAGGIVNRSLAVVNVSGFVIGVVLLLTGVVNFRKARSRSAIVEVISLILLTVATGVGQWLIAVRLHALRLTLAVPVDQIPANDPRRISFDALHANSVRALSVAMIAALVGFIAIAYRARTNA